MYTLKGTVSYPFCLVWLSISCFSKEFLLAVANPVRVRGKTTQTVFGTLMTVILLLLLKQTIFLQTSLAELLQSH